MKLLSNISRKVGVGDMGWKMVISSNSARESFLRCYFGFLKRFEKYSFLIFIFGGCPPKKQPTKVVKDWLFGKSTAIFFSKHWTISLLLFFGRSLMIGWRKNSWNPERMPTVVTFVSVCLCVHFYYFLFSFLFSFVRPKSVTRSRRTHRQTDRQTDMNVTTEFTLSGFQEFFLQPIHQGSAQQKKKRKKKENSKNEKGE